MLSPSCPGCLHVIDEMMAFALGAGARSLRAHDDLGSLVYALPALSLPGRALQPCQHPHR